MKKDKNNIEPEDFLNFATVTRFLVKSKKGMSVDGIRKNSIPEIHIQKVHNLYRLIKRWMSNPDENPENK
jgi:hypothetical protein